MLTEIKAYSAWESAPTLLLSDTGRAETDLVQIRNISGLEPVKASVNTSAYGSVDGADYAGSSVLSRNIVLTIHPNPNWAEWTYEGLRRLLYSYFMPKMPVRLEFYSDDMGPVKIEGIVESVEVNPFSSDPELLVSIICPDPYFTALNPTVVSGQAIRSGGTVTVIDYTGTIETGFQVEVTYASGSSPSVIGVQVGNPSTSFFNVYATVDASLYFEMNSLPMQKMVQNVNMDNGLITNLLASIESGSTWPTLKNGDNDFSIVTNVGVQDWELTYSERFGGL